MSQLNRTTEILQYLFNKWRSLDRNGANLDVTGSIPVHNTPCSAQNRLLRDAENVFYEALINPPEPNEKLKEAARRYREYIGG